MHKTKKAAVILHQQMVPNIFQRYESFTYVTHLTSPAVPAMFMNATKDGYNVVVVILDCAHSELSQANANRLVLSVCSTFTHLKYQHWI